MWKIWLAATVAVTASFMTIFLGIMNDIRYSVILYRALWAFIFSGVAVVAAGFFYEKFLLTYLLSKTVGNSEVKAAEAVEDRAKSEAIADEASAEESALTDGAANEDSSTPEFSPFTTTNLDHVSSPKS